MRGMMLGKKKHRQNNQIKKNYGLSQNIHW